MLLVTSWHVTRLTLCTITRLITCHTSHATPLSSENTSQAASGVWHLSRYWHPAVYDKETLCVVQSLTKKANLCVCYWHGKWWFLGGQGKELTQPLSPTEIIVGAATVLFSYFCSPDINLQTDSTELILGPGNQPRCYSTDWWSDLREGVRWLQI